MHEKTVLDNGLRIVSSTMPHTRSVCICVFMGAGSRYESPDQVGVSHFLEHLCFKGTERRPTSMDISETIDGVGGVLNAVTDKELTVYWAKVARSHFRLALDLLADMIRCSKLDPAEVENERKVIIEELNGCMDSPQSRVDVLIDEVLWPDQPLGRYVVGNKDTIATIDRRIMLDYLNRHYIPTNAVVSVAGDVGHDEVVQTVADALGDWPGGEPGSWVAAENSQDGPRLAIVPRKIEQTQVCLAVHGLHHLHPNRFALDLLNVVLGEGMSSRLFMELRERRGLAYEIYSHASYFRDSGSVGVYAGVHPTNVRAAIGAILEELARLRDEAIPEKEIVKAKELSKGHLLLRMEDTRSVAGWTGGQELLTDRIRDVDEIVSLVDAVTADDLQEVARQLLQTSKLNLALVGPVRKGDRLERLLKL